MKDKTIFRPSFDNPIHTGKVFQNNPEKLTGRIKTDNGEELFFKYSFKENESLKTGNTVTFYKYPCINKPDQFYAKNVTKAYLSKDGCLVVDSLQSHVHDGIRSRLPSIINRIACLGRDYVSEQICFSAVIGKSACVPITWEDDIVYAKRLGRDRYTKFVKNIEPIPTQYVSIFLKKKQSVYLIKSCYYGNYRTDDELNNGEFSFSERFEFWNTHALVFGSEPIDSSTITTICPWTGINEINRLGSLMKKQ